MNQGTTEHRGGACSALVIPGAEIRRNARQSKVPFNRPQLPMMEADSPEKVAAKILEAVETGAAETVID